MDSIFLQQTSTVSRKPERGLALVTVMLIVSIVASIAAFMSLNQQLWFRQTGNELDRARAENNNEVELARRQALVSSITQGGFDYHFQPIFNVETGGVYGYEALVRPRADAFRGPPRRGCRGWPSRRRSRA